jgi:hypothetical protein
MWGRSEHCFLGCKREKGELPLQPVKILDSGITEMGIRVEQKCKCKEEISYVEEKIMLDRVGVND